MSTLLDYIRQARSFKLKNITEIADKAGIPLKYMEQYGNYKAKVSPSLLNDLPSNQSGKYIIVTAITPTKAGEGKTLTTTGLSMALNKIGKKAIACLRQPSLGPLFGSKGGATGGGMCQVVPPEDINFFLTGDFPTIETCHNLITSFVYNHISYNLQPTIKKVLWKRVIDINDRTLRRITLKINKETEFESGFDLTPASEVMAILALAKDYKDLIRRLENIIVGIDDSEYPVRLKDINAAGPASILLRKTMWPNLLQTSEGTPCFMHAGPFGNIAHGNSSIISDYIALRLFDYVVTESGFGSELGFEKFLNIKCRVSGLWPDCAVLVVTARAIKEHGFQHLAHNINIVKGAGVPCAIAINKFESDSRSELEDIRNFVLNNGADAAEIVEFFSKGSEGGTSLASYVASLASKNSPKQNFFYNETSCIEDKISALAKRCYLADGIDLSKKAKQSIERIKKWKMENLPICIAKNHLSLTHDAEMKAVPNGYKLPITDLDVRAGAGYIYVLCGNIMTLPGLPEQPPSLSYTLDETGDFKL